MSTAPAAGPARDPACDPACNPASDVRTGTPATPATPAVAGPAPTGNMQPPADPDAPQTRAAPAAPAPLQATVRTRLGWRHLPALARDAAVSWVEDGASSMGASLAYYTLFSIAPLLLIVIAVAGAVFGTDAARGEIFSQLQGLLGNDGAGAVRGLLESVQRNGQSGLGAALGGVLLLVGATTVFAELQRALDLIWRVPVRRRWPGWVQFLRTRLLSFGLILGVGFLMMVSLVVSAGLAAWSRWWAPMFGGLGVVLEVANFVFGLVLTTALFSMIFKWMPSAVIAWRDVLAGAAVTSLLFFVGKTLIGLYIGTSGVASGFGAASSVVVLLVWVYYSAQVFLVGAEITWLYARRHGSLALAPQAVHTTLPPQPPRPEGV